MFPIQVVIQLHNSSARLPVEVESARAAMVSTITCLVSFRPVSEADFVFMMGYEMGGFILAVLSRLGFRKSAKE